MGCVGKPSAYLARYFPRPQNSNTFSGGKMDKSITDHFTIQRRVEDAKQSLSAAETVGQYCEAVIKIMEAFYIDTQGAVPGTVLHNRAVRSVMEMEITLFLNLTGLGGPFEEPPLPEKEGLNGAH